MPDSKFNLYDILELDPSVTDENGIKAQIKKKAAEFGRVQETDPEVLKNKKDRFRSNETELTAVAANQNERQRHAAEYLAMIRNRQDKANFHIDLLVRRGGTFTPTDLSSIAGYTDLSASTVKELFDRAGLKPGAPPPPGPKFTPLPPRTDSTTAKGIEQALAVAGLGTLYEFLARDNGGKYDSKTTDKTLGSRFREVEAALNKMSRGTPQHNRDNALLGYVKTILLVPDARTKYDNYCQVRSLELHVKGLIETAGRGTKSLTSQDYQFVVQQAQTFGVSTATAESYVQETLVSKTWALLRPSNEGPVAPLPVCGHCNKASAVGAQRCGHCGMPLLIDCPSCHAHGVPTSLKCCPTASCGFPTGDLPEIDRLMKLARSALASGNTAGAKTQGDRIAFDWPSYSPVKAFLADVAAADKRTTEARDARMSQVKKVHDLADARKFVEASKLVRDFDASRPAGASGSADLPPDLRKRITDRLNDARTRLLEARAAAAKADYATAIARTESALDLVIDFDEAQNELRRFPPSSPTGLTARIEPTRVHLAWTAAANERNLSFSVFRKEQGACHSPADAFRIGTTAAGMFDDTSAAVGKVWYYSVFAVRSEVSYSKPAVSDPVLRMGKPEIVRAVASRKTAHIEFTPPHGCLRVDVARSPAGDKMLRTGNTIVDEGLTNGQTYTYQLRAAYQNPAGTTPLSSETTAVSLTPQEPPAQVRDLDLTLNGPVVLIKWTAPPVGRVVLRELDREPTDLTPGMQIDTARVETIGKPIQVLSPNSTQMPVPKAGRLVVVPMTVSGTTAVVGPWRQVSSLSEVTGVEARFGSIGRVDALWVWPPGLDKAVVTLFADAEGKNPCGRCRVAKGEFEHRGGYVDIDYGSAVPAVVRVQSVSACETFQSTGVFATVQKGGRGSVRYRIENGQAVLALKNLIKKSVFKLLQKPGPAGSTAPTAESPRYPALLIESEQCDRIRDLVLVGLPNRLPLSIDDGERIFTADVVTLVNGRAHVALDGVAVKKPMYLRAFVQRPELQPSVQLQPASKEQLVLKPR